MHKPGLLIYFCGGLGNQLFQYAFARRLSLENNLDIYADTKSGFARDFIYRRTFELNSIPGVHLKPVSNFQLIYIYSYFLCKRILRYLRFFCPPLFFRDKYVSESFNYFRLPGCLFISETDHGYSEKVIYLSKKQQTFLMGYWQSFSYIQPISPLLQTELQPPVPRDNDLVEIGKKLRELNTLALGIRLYEDSPDPTVNCHGKLLKPVNLMGEQLALLKSQFPDLHTAVFCTHRPSCLDDTGLDLLHTTFLTGEDGVVSALDTLWLLTQCKHHLFLNSTLYWWGAFLSQSLYGGPSKGQQIIASDNFINQTVYPPDWKLF